MTPTSAPRRIPIAPTTVDPALTRITEDNYLQLLAQIRAAPAHVGFFCGAGISVEWPGRMPASRDFQFGCITGLATFSVRFGARFEALRVGTAGARLDTDTVPLESLLQFLKDARGEDAIDVCDVYRSSAVGASPNTTHGFLGEWIARGLGPVFTVNIDHLIEDATDLLLARDGRNAADHAYVHANVHVFPPDLLAGQLYKMHGTALDRGTLRMTLDRVTTTLPRGAEELFRRFLQLSAVCFLGWAGADLDLRPLILQEAASGRAGSLFYLLHVRDGDDERQVRSRNRKAFELIDATGALPLYGSSGALTRQLGQDVFGWSPVVRVFDLPRDLPPLDEVAAKKVEAIIRGWGLDDGESDALAGRVAGHIYMHLGMHEQAHDAWAEVLDFDSAADGASRATLLRNMAHARFRLHDIRKTLRDNTGALHASETTGDRLGRAWALYGLGSVCAAWPLAAIPGFLWAGRRLEAAVAEFRALRDISESGTSRAWREATRGEASSLYWLARWRQRWFGVLISRSRRLRRSLTRLYERSAALLEDERINDVNELVNPLRSLALVLAHGDPQDRQRALELAGKAEDLVRWTIDRQRVSTVLRDVALVHELAGTPEHLQLALGHWLEALEIAASPARGDHPPPPPAPPTPEEALSLARRVRDVTGTQAVADANGLGQALYGIATTISRMGAQYGETAAEVARCGLDVLSRLPLPIWSKRFQALQLRLLFLRLPFRPGKAYSAEDSK